jgi:hypothetical protein
LSHQHLLLNPIHSERIYGYFQNTQTID